MEMQQAVLSLLNTFSAAKQRVALREIARYLLRANRSRISRNVEPDGSKMAARQAGKRRMFRKIGRFMQQRTSTDRAEVGFSGSTGKIATNHQLGRSIRVGTYTADFPVRELLGLNAADQQGVMQILLKHSGVAA